MIYEVTFKTPDATEPMMEDLESGEERDKLLALCDKHIEYGELVTIVFDTRKNTVTVKECK